MTELTEPRPYSDEWRSADEVEIETPYGPIIVQPLGWGIRASAAPTPLRVNGGDVRLGWADFHETSLGVWTCDNLRTGLHGPLSDATPKQRDKLADVLPNLIGDWAILNRAEVDRRAAAYQSDRARVCEESIRELETLLIEYRARLARIEAGDRDVSPYLNGGRRITTGTEG